MLSSDNGLRLMYLNSSLNERQNQFQNEKKTFFPFFRSNSESFSCDVEFRSFSSPLRSSDEASSLESLMPDVGSLCLLLSLSEPAISAGKELRKFRFLSC